MAPDAYAKVYAYDARKRRATAAPPAAAAVQKRRLPAAPTSVRSPAADLDDGASASSPAPSVGTPHREEEGGPPPPPRREAVAAAATRGRRRRASGSQASRASRARPDDPATAAGKWKRFLWASYHPGKRGEASKWRSQLKMNVKAPGDGADGAAAASSRRYFTLGSFATEVEACLSSTVLLANGLRGAALQAGGESGEYTFEAFIAALFRGKRGSFIKERVAVEDRSDFFRICREAWRQYEALAPSVRLKESEAFAAHLQEHPALLAPGKLEAMVTKAAAVEALVALPDRGPEAGGGASAKGAALERMAHLVDAARAAEEA